MAREKKKQKSRDPKFHWPLVEDRCVKLVIPKDRFHQRSFRNVRVPTKKNASGSSFLLVGCPKFVKGRGMAKAHPTAWYEGPKAVETKTQCRWVSGPKEGQKAGMRAHIVVEKSKGGRCRAGYEKAAVKKARSKGKKR